MLRSCQHTDTCNWRCCVWEWLAYWLMLRSGSLWEPKPRMRPTPMGAWSWIWEKNWEISTSCGTRMTSGAVGDLTAAKWTAFQHRTGLIEFDYWSWLHWLPVADVLASLARPAHSHTYQASYRFTFLCSQPLSASALCLYLLSSWMLESIRTSWLKSFQIDVTGGCGQHHTIPNESH